MIKRIKSVLKRKLIKTHVVETFSLGEVVYKVIDYTSPLPFIKNKRNLAFKRDNSIYSHSAIYLNPKFHFQPILTIPQKIIALWGEQNTIKTATVLGCAGCSIPRFISLHYPESKTIGVELCEEFITIAKKHFLLEEISNQFELIHDDAIKFIKEKKLQEKQSLILVDIFNDNKIIPEIFTDDFLFPLYESVNENGLIIINVLGENKNELKSFFNNLDLPFKSRLIVCNQTAQFMILTKSTDDATETAFLNSLKGTKDFSVY